MTFLRVVPCCLTVAVLLALDSRLAQGDPPSADRKPAKEEFVDVLGDKYRLPGPDDCQAVVLLFVGHDCPISNSYTKEIVRLCKDYMPKKVAFCVVYADAHLGKEARKHAKEYGFCCPAILDSKMTLARKVGATVKPEAAVLSPRGELLYRGRIDNRYVDFGKRREQVTSRELTDALEAVLAGKPVATPRTRAIGCDIDFPKGEPVKGELARKIDRRLAELAARDFSGVVLVAQKEKVILARGYGFADRARQLPFTPDTVFDIGSITKPFTATAILRLEMDGKLKVTDSITTYFKNVPEDKTGITLHHLLTHTSGFRDSLGGDYDRISRDGFIELALASRLRLKPGQSYSYSNVGYSLLGAIVEQITGASYDKYLHDQLCHKAGMTKTGYVLPKWGKDELARGYRNDKDWGTPLDHAWAEDGPYWNLRANGGLLSTVGDLHRWSMALQGEGLLSKQARQKQFHAHVSEGILSGGSHYGYGWSIGKTRQGKKVWQHNGSNGIFFADFRIYPDDGLVMILATNASGLRYMSELNDLEKVVFDR